MTYHSCTGVWFNFIECLKKKIKYPVFDSNGFYNVDEKLGTTMRKHEGYTRV